MKIITRRHILLSGIALAMAQLAHAGSQPAADKNAIRFLVGFSAGGGTDMVARLIAEKLRDVLGQTVIVENRAGAGGRIAADALVSATPDGDTFMVANNAVLTFQTLVFGKQIKWNYKHDFAPVVGITSYPLGLAVPSSLGVKTLPELISWLKAHPAQATFGTTGLGGQTHFLGEALGQSIGVAMNAVPYKGATPMVTDLVGGQLPAAVGLMDDMLKFHRAGSIRVIGIFSATRSPLIPDIPTINEQGYKLMVSEGWQGIWAPAKTPRAKIERIQNAVKKVLEMPDVQRAMMTRLNVQPTYRSASEVALLSEAEMKQWEPIIKASGFKPD